MTRQILLWSVVAFTALTSVVQAAPPPPAPVQTSSDATGASIVNNYRLGPGDKIRLIVFGEDSLAGEFFVANAGTISLPLIGDIRAEGLTTAELQAKIGTKLSDGYLKDPHVSLEVITFRPFYILGEVNHPGEYPFTANLTLLSAVATAGGYTYRANTRRVMIKHPNESTEQEVVVTSTTPVGPGDTVRVKERFF